jgi:hypothetical protein
MEKIALIPANAPPGNAMEENVGHPIKERMVRLAQLAACIAKKALASTISVKRIGKREPPAMQMRIVLQSIA